MSTDGRDGKGQFAPGNRGGPGRPRRIVEQDYQTAIYGEISLDDVCEIAACAVEDAKNGNPKVRDWVTARVLGTKPMSLLELAVNEQAGVTADAQIDELAEELKLQKSAHEGRGPAISRHADDQFVGHADDYGGMRSRVHARRCPPRN